AQIALRAGDVALQDAGCLAGRTNPPDAIFDGLLDVGVPGVTQMAHAGGQIGRADEDAVHALDRHDLIKVGEGFGRFHLAQQTDVVLGLWQVVAYGPPACHPRDGGTHATDAVRRVTNRRHRPARFLGRLHHGHQQVARPDVQQALDLNRVVPGGTYDRRDRISGQRLQL